MCGILGGINTQITESLLNTIKHRGPDRQALYRDCCCGNDICLAHTRLSIVDLTESGNQPMVSRCGNYVLIFNGEIYNHLELRKCLKFKDFKGYSDTETLLYLLIEYGVDAISKLNGIFGFAFYDKIKHKLILARDHYGVKPVYYSFNQNRLIFSSEIRPIKSVLKPRLDIRALNILLNLRYVPSPYTLFEGVKKIRPGHYCIFDIKVNKIEEHIFPFLTKNPNSTKDISFDEAVNEYGIKLKEAVERQLMGDVEMGMLLSGGIDSAVVGGLASKSLNRKMHAFTVGFDSKYKVNEIGLAAETAKYFGMEHHVIKMDSSNFFDTFAECSRIVEEPLATTSFIPMYYLSKLASQHVKVVLTGQGADEPLGGYGRYQGEILREKYPSFLFGILSFLIKKSKIKKESLIRGSRSLSINNDVERFMNVYSLFTTDEIKLMTGYDVSQDSMDLINYYYHKITATKSKSVEKMMAIDLHMDLPDDLLLYTDKVTMNFSLECRVPMLDTELVKFLQTLPTDYKVKRHQTKIIHKKYAERFLPNSFINRPKFGFQSPTDVWFREQSDFIESTLLNGLLKDYINKDMIKNVIKQHKQGYNKEKQIFLLLSLNEWLKNNLLQN